MDTARLARVLMKSCNNVTLTLVTKQYNDFFPVSHNIAFSVIREGEILINLDNLKTKSKSSVSDSQQVML